MAKRRLTPSEKFTLMSETLAREEPRTPAYMVIVTVDEETDSGEPIITVVRMRDTMKKLSKKSKRR